MRRVFIDARADERRAVKGVAVVGSYQTHPHTGTPFKIRARAHSDTGSTEYDVSLSLTRDEAQKLVSDWLAMGLFGRNGRVETAAA